MVLGHSWAALLALRYAPQDRDRSVSRYYAIRQPTCMAVTQPLDLSNEPELAKLIQSVNFDED